MSMRNLPLPVFALTLAITGSLSHSRADAADIGAPAVEVVGLSPVRGLEQPREEVPGHLQSIDARALRESKRQPLPELLGNRISGINVNEIQGNPYQADVNFRGFSASPLLGTPQGISVYQDGVRINEPFGDSVNWDLVPRAAIGSIDLIPGSNPLFGLNTLGGALSIRTKDGFANPGSALEASAGSFGRREVEAEFGGKQGDMGLYAAASMFREDGWRDFSPSRVGQLFLKLSQQRGPLEWDLAYTHADTDLIGNGLLPDSMLRARRAAIFTKPDNTRNRLHLLSFGASYWLDDKARLTGTLYHRSNRVRTLNGDANDAFEGGTNDGDAGANLGLGFNIDTAANNRTATQQRGWGGALQWSRIDDNNHVAFGITGDFSRSTFQQTTELGVFDSQRGVISGGAGEVLNNRLDGTSASWSLFATDTWKPRSDLAITTSLRLNQTRVTTRDQLRAVAPNLDGDQLYTKLNPAIGANWTVTPGFSVFANVAQGNRAPSPIELGCADRANPCSLPNAMQADPFLAQVVTQTFEAVHAARPGCCAGMRPCSAPTIAMTFSSSAPRPARATSPISAARGVPGSSWVPPPTSAPFPCVPTTATSRPPIARRPACSRKTTARAARPPNAPAVARTTKSWSRPATASPGYPCTASSSAPTGAPMPTGPCRPTWSPTRASSCAETRTTRTSPAPTPTSSAADRAHSSVPARHPAMPC